MKGSGELILYLDFDGVLHHENCLWHPRRGAYLVAPERYRLFQHLDLLEELLQPYPNLKIVLSTSWVLRYGVTTSTKRLSPPLQTRVIGATFHSRHMQEDNFRQLHRGQQVIEDATRRAPRAWLALDDDGEGWGKEHAVKLVHTHMYEGISDPDVFAEAKGKLASMCAAPFGKKKP